MPYKNYDAKSLEDALTSIRNGRMTAFKASKEYKVPYQTLLDKIHNKHMNPSGHATVLKKEEEQLLVKWIHYMAEIGFPVTREQLIHSVGKLVKELNRENPFKDGLPGRHWYESFLKRNPSISKRVTQALTTARISATEENIRGWFDKVYKYLEENNHQDVLQDPSRIFNCDESAFFLNPKGQAVLARRGQKTVYYCSGNDDKQNITLCLGASANGKLMPILTLFPYKRIPTNILKKCPKSWVTGRSDNGWMTCENFYEYIANNFNNFLIKENIQKPVLLCLDGHVSHLSLPLTTFCKENGIILVALLPSSTHVLQPMDVAVFHALKNSWRKSVYEWRMANNAQKMKLEEFSPIIDSCIQNTLKPEIFINGFRTTGLFPFDQNAINYNNLLKSSDHQSTQSSDVESNDEPIIKQYEQENLKFIAFFENKLGTKKLASFEECNGVWEGDIRDENLYYLWKELKGRNEVLFDIGDSTLLANIESTLTDTTLNWGNDNILEGIVDHDGTVIFDAHLSPPNPTASQSIGSEQFRQGDDSSNQVTNEPEEAIEVNNISCNEFNPSLNSSLKQFVDNPDEFQEGNKNSNSSNFVLDSSSKQIKNDFVQSQNENQPNISNSVNGLDSVLDKSVESHNVTPTKKINDQTPKAVSEGVVKSQFPTPFKNTLLWPETPSATKAKKNIKKKIIPTVAVAEEFLEYQRRLEKEKKEKIEKVEARKKEREEKGKERKEKGKERKEKAKEREEKAKQKTVSKKTRIVKTPLVQDTSSSQSFETGEYVVVNYEGEKFPGVIVRVCEDAASKTTDIIKYDVKTMTMSGFDPNTGRVNWRWLEKDDILSYDAEEIVKKINTPVLINKRGVYSVPDFESGS